MSSTKNNGLYVFIILLLLFLLIYFFTIVISPQEGMTSSNQSNNSNQSNQSNSTSTVTSYNHYSGVGTVFYGDNNTTATLEENENGNPQIRLSLPSDPKKFIILSGSNSNTTDTNNNTTTTSNNTIESYISGNTYKAQYYNWSYVGPNGLNAKFILDENNQYVLQVRLSDGNIYIYKIQPINPITSSYVQPVSSINSWTPSTITSPFVLPYYGGPNAPISYDNGIPASQIPPGQEDLYILKSQVVPPVCPICPSITSSESGSKKCPPCPACARCPESNFECKKVPNYDTIPSSDLPSPYMSGYL